MKLMRDEDLLRDPMIRLAVEARRAAAPPPTSPIGRWPIKWLMIGLAIGVLLIVLLGIVR